jgi:hypothetical protein
MPKFTVKCQCYVEEVAEIEVEADSYQQAVQQVMNEDLMVDADWQDGTDSYEPEIYLVVDDKGKTVWDRNLDRDGVIAILTGGEA